MGCEFANPQLEDATAIKTHYFAIIPAMTERLSSEQEAALVESAFEPGTLVHGLREEVWLGKTLRNGILPTTFYGLIRLSVCMAMLDNDPNRKLSYVRAFHEGPKGRDDNKIGFLISAQAVMDRHPGLLGTIGGCFVSRMIIGDVEYSDLQRYNVDQKGQTTFGIPIYSTDGPHWDDEVRLRCHDETETVTPDMWKGIVIAKKNLSYLLAQARNANFTHDTPVFSTDLEVITPSLAGLARKK